VNRESVLVYFFLGSDVSSTKAVNCEDKQHYQKDFWQSKKQSFNWLNKNPPFLCPNVWIGVKPIFL